MEDNTKLKMTYEGRHPLIEMNLDGRGPYMEDNLTWKTTLKGRQLQMEDDLR